MALWVWGIELWVRGSRTSGGGGGKGEREGGDGPGELHDCLLAVVIAVVLVETTLFDRRGVTGCILENRYYRTRMP